MYIESCKNIILRAFHALYNFEMFIIFSCIHHKGVKRIRTDLFRSINNARP